MKRTFVCASSCIKHYVQPSYGCRGTRVCVFILRKKNNLIHNLITKKYWNKNENILKKRTKSRDAAAKKNRYKRRDKYIV